jgi:AraC-like DNA-binding protein
LPAADKSIARVSREVGFRTPSHFSTVFRRSMGVTPRAYRAAVRRARTAQPEASDVAR